MYKVDGQLVGISVIDILPACVSSVYFIWDPDWAWASLGKLSAMHEVALSLEMNRAGAEGMRYLYMGAFPSFRLSSFLLEPPSTDKDSALTDSRILDRKLCQDAVQIRILALLPS